MKMGMWVSLTAMSLLQGSLALAQERRGELRFMAELARPVQEIFMSRSAYMEVMGQYRSDRLGFHLAGGFAQSGIRHGVYSNVDRYRSQGWFLKPGVLLFSKEYSFQVGLAYGLSFVREKGEALIKGQGWGDRPLPYQSRSRESFFEFFLAQKIRITPGCFAYIGLSQAVLLGREHRPAYIAGYGLLHHPYFAYIRAGLGFSIGRGKLKKPAPE